MPTRSFFWGARDVADIPPKWHTVDPGDLRFKEFVGRENGLTKYANPNQLSVPRRACHLIHLQLLAGSE
jgi:hypothetical protein